jgi:hypothetical protein
LGFGVDVAVAVGVGFADGVAVLVPVAVAVAVEVAVAVSVAVAVPVRVAVAVRVAAAVAVGVAVALLVAVAVGVAVAVAVDVALAVRVAVPVVVGVADVGVVVGVDEGSTGPIAEPDSRSFFREPLVALLVIRIDEWNFPLAKGSNITVTVLVPPGARSKGPPPLIIWNGAEGDPTIPATEVLPLALSTIERVSGIVTRPNDK